MTGQECIIQFIEHCIRLFQQSPVVELVPDLERLRLQIADPCEVAIVGQVKAGKSTLLNALLGEDLAQTGITETTATINYFRYGTVTDETREFLAGLQGKDIETLRRADEIEKLEFLLPHEYLRDVTLVDTPGTGAVVDEHENRTAEYLKLRNRLRERHDGETRNIGGTADAVVYVIGHVARADDRAFLEAFGATRTGSSGPYNSVGVISKIDLDPQAVKCREELCSKIKRQLKNELNGVVPVSGGLRRALDRLLANQRAGLKHLLV